MVDSEGGTRGIARGVEGDVASLVAKEERNKVLIMEWSRLRCR